MDDVLERLLSMEPPKLPEKNYKVKRLSAAAGGDIIFRLRALPYSRVADIRRLDYEDQSVHIALAGTVSPDLKSKELLDKYKAATPAELLKDLLLPGEIDDLALQVEKLSGYKSAVTEEVKKN
jgi:hypothetical protein